MIGPLSQRLAATAAADRFAIQPRAKLRPFAREPHGDP
ncbi:hypothetical protein HRUBRA_00567 [Pseudohaliea rubra DSM 19751]|uniref:Uncharacterized protein n=1 Tax=Pseudohaliea rubra DSM 19751 TaxID=1265313 RepID=A0A095X1R3_9GAMM|nr:hypothetical protein HRUBRA_00567 [Pseudohaliea rubra DSM 19751]